MTQPARVHQGQVLPTNLVAVQDGGTASVDKGRAMDAISLAFCKAFDTVPLELTVQSIMIQSYQDTIEVTKRKMKVTRTKS